MPKFLFLILFILGATQTFASPGDPVADAVLGQSLFTTATAQTGAAGLNGAAFVAVDPRNGRIYVSDFDYNRILSWPSAAAFTSGQSADKVIGQANFTGTQGNRGDPSAIAAANNLFNPNGIAVDNAGNLYVADSLNNRVLEYDDPSQETGDISADRVFGQPGFITRSSGLSSIKFDSPYVVAIDPAGRLFVTDQFNRRVVAFDAPLTSDTVADKVWGQASLTVKDNTSLNDPQGITFDLQGNLYVTSKLFNRVTEYDLGYDMPGTTNTTPNRVFGQTSLNGASTGTTDSLTKGPRGLCVDVNGNLYVVDSGNNRILIFNLPPLIQSPNITEPAGGLIGQLNFTSGAASTTSSTFSNPRGCAFDKSGNLFVADYGNSRVLRFDKYTVDPAPVTRFTSSFPIIVKDNSTALPNPSQITVSDIDGEVTRVIVNLKHMNHTFPGDMDIYLQGPQGQKVTLMSDCGGSTDILHANITLDSQAANFMPDTSPALVSGTYKPTNINLSDTIPMPGSTSLNDFNGLNPNGTWSLFVLDDVNGDQGAIGAWGLDIYTKPSIFTFTAPSPLTAGISADFSTFVFYEVGDSVTYSWDFGDATPLVGGDSVTHTFAAQGTYFVTLTVTAQFGGVASQTKTVTVNAAPTNTPTNTPTSTSTPTATVTSTPVITGIPQLTPNSSGTASPAPTGTTPTISVLNNLKDKVTQAIGLIASAKKEIPAGKDPKSKAKKAVITAARKELNGIIAALIGLLKTDSQTITVKFANFTDKNINSVKAAIKSGTSKRLTAKQRASGWKSAKKVLQLLIK